MLLLLLMLASELKKINNNIKIQMKKFKDFSGNEKFMLVFSLVLVISIVFSWTRVSSELKDVANSYIEKVDSE